MTVVGGVVGVWNTSHCPDTIVLIIGDDNTINILRNGETIISNEKYSVIKQPVLSKYDYLVKLPKSAREQIAQYDGAFNSMVVDGYIELLTEPIYVGADSDLFLAITGTQKSSTDLNGLPFYPTSIFKRIEIE